MICRQARGRRMRARRSATGQTTAERMRAKPPDGQAAGQAIGERLKARTTGGKDRERRKEGSKPDVRSPQTRDVQVARVASPRAARVFFLGGGAFFVSYALPSQYPRGPLQPSLAGALPLLSHGRGLPVGDGPQVVLKPIGPHQSIVNETLVPQNPKSNAEG